jgi:hypothetical protein
MIRTGDHHLLMIIKKINDVGEREEEGRTNTVAL